MVYHSITGMLGAGVLGECLKLETTLSEQQQSNADLPVSLNVRLSVR
jgi:hypothetical protein